MISGNTRKLEVTATYCAALTITTDSGGKSKTMTQLVALGFFLGAPMASSDWARFFGADTTHFAGVVDAVGVWIFVAGTVLSVWSGYRYISRNARLVFADE